MFHTLSQQFLSLRNRHFLLIDVAIFAITPVLALFLRLDGAVDFSHYHPSLLWVTLLFLILKLGLLHLFGFYRRCWRYASVDELQQIAITLLTTIILQSLLLSSVQQISHFPFQNLPRSLPFLDAILSFLLIGSIRFSVPILERLTYQRRVFSGAIAS